MTDTWPAAPIVTTRLRIRAARAGDEGALAELHTDPQVRAHLGGPLAADAARAVPVSTLDSGRKSALRG